MMVSRDIMRSTTRGFEKYYNPKVGNEVRLDTNVNVLGSNPAAMEFLSGWKGDINGYPNTYSDDLRDALADLYGLQRENFVAGNGSDEVIDVTFKTFTEYGDGCAVPVPSYVLYDFFVKMNGGRTIEVDLTEDFQLDVDAFLKTGAKVAIMPSPNNPTGNSFREKVVRTFSKAYAMAGLRVGYAVSNLKVAGMMNCVKIPYSLNMLSEKAAIAAVKDQGFIGRSVELVKEQRPKLDAGLRRLGFETYPSDSNFILARSPVDHAALVSGLKNKGVMIRDFGSKRRTENCVRITVGSEELNALLLDKAAEVIGECL